MKTNSTTYTSGTNSNDPLLNTICSDNRCRLGVILATLVLSGLLLYRDALWFVVTIVLSREDSSHGVFVPIIFFYMIYRNRQAITCSAMQSNYYGLPLFLLGAGIPFLFPEEMHIQALGYIVFCAGTALLVSGNQFFKTIAFPLLFMITMIPLPEKLYDQIAEISRTIAMAGSLKLAALLDIPFYREGWHVQLHNIVLKVAISCSGIRYLISYIVFALAYAYFFKKTRQRKIITVLAAIPLSITASILRLTLIFALVHYVSPKMAEYWPHIIISWLVFFAFFVGALWIDNKLKFEKE